MTSYQKTLDHQEDEGLTVLLISVLLSVGILSIVLLTMFMIWADISLLPDSQTWPAFLAQQAQIMGFPLAGESSAFWYMSRAAGLLAYAFIWGSMIWGLLLSTKLLKPHVSPLLAFGIHETFSLLGLGFALFHALILLGDSYVDFDLLSIFLPFSASYEPLWTGLGTLSFYAYALIILSFYVRKHIGQKLWRRLHYLNFGIYAMALVHGFQIGSDTQHSLVFYFYVGSTTLLLFLIFYRILIQVNLKP